MNDPLRILHVASFLGNIGDNANHAGFRPWFEGLLNRPVQWTEFEIRDVYRRVSAFDAEFVRRANSADLVVIGGGNYFELWVDTSPTGTSISIADEHLQQITTPLFFNALGVDAGQGLNEVTKARFTSFLGRLLRSDQFLVSVRNDGAHATLVKYVSKLPLEKVVALPDGGFFADYRDAALRPESSSKQPKSMKIGINLAGDMLPRRFAGIGDAHSYETFLREFAGALETIWCGNMDAKFVFFPHIFSDLKVYADLLTLLPDHLRRDHARVAAYDAGDEAARVTFFEYATCHLIFGMRFHSNVVAIGNMVPTVGLACYDQIHHLFSELGMRKYLVDVAKPGFTQSLVAHVDNLREEPGSIHADLLAMNAQVRKIRDAATGCVSDWLAGHHLVRN